jgi:hypothetical protein
MLTLTIMDFDTLKGTTDGRFADFYGERGVLAALTAEGRVVGLAAVEFGGGTVTSKPCAEPSCDVVRRGEVVPKPSCGGVVITKLRAEPPYDALECRRFFIRSLVLKLLANRTVIRTRFCDGLLAEIGFEDDGSGGMACSAEKVVFKKICEA